VLPGQTPHSAPALSRFAAATGQKRRHSFVIAQDRETYGGKPVSATILKRIRANGRLMIYA